MVTANNRTRHEREIVITRTFDAPRDLVFKAWTDPKMLMQWWGPHGFTAPRCEVDPRVGGAILIVMRGPDGFEMPVSGAFTQFDPPSSIAYTNEVPDGEGNLLIEGRTTVTFVAQGNKTEITVESWAAAYGDIGAMAVAGMFEGWTQSLEKLSNSFVADRAIMTTRSFDAPRELVYKAFTTPEHVAQWWGPNGFTNTIHTMDVRPGGVWTLTMHGPDGRDYPNEIRFVEVVPNELLRYDHGGDGDPEMFHVTVTFRSFEDKTWLTMEAVFDTVEQRRKVAEEYGAIEGAVQTLERLAQYVNKM
jgi:uncharacterized protein YndB with AHSA1/START domain